ncbi:MAG TPA: hypothetical protein VF022_09430, partial [Rhodanobacteraceae bacterium]
MNSAHFNRPRTAEAARGAVARARPHDPAFSRSAATEALGCGGGLRAGIAHNGGSAMFESKRDDVEALMKADPEFRRLYLHHK